jgi:hypothetical protein
MVKHFKVSVGGDVSGKIVGGDLIIQNSYNKIKNSNVEIARAIEEIGEHITKTNEMNHNSDEVADVFKELQDKIASEDKPHMIKMVWNNLVELVPSINSITNAVLAIKSLFTS